MPGNILLHHSSTRKRKGPNSESIPYHKKTSSLASRKQSVVHRKNQSPNVISTFSSIGESTESEDNKENMDKDSKSGSDEEAFFTKDEKEMCPGG
eukprot:12681804-Ditylum_brightwellii.AAC.1